MWCFFPKVDFSTDNYISGNFYNDNCSEIYILSGNLELLLDEVLYSNYEEMDGFVVVIFCSVKLLNEGFASVVLLLVGVEICSFG